MKLLLIFLLSFCLIECKGQRWTYHGVDSTSLFTVPKKISSVDSNFSVPKMVGRLFPDIWRYDQYISCGLRLRNDFESYFFSDGRIEIDTLKNERDYYTRYWPDITSFQPDSAVTFIIRLDTLLPKDRVLVIIKGDTIFKK